MKKQPDKRKSILMAAEKLATKRRFHEVTLDDVAAQAAVGKGTIYLYFKDKEDLFFEMAREGFAEQIKKVEKIAVSGGDVRDRLIKVAEAISSHIQRHHALIRFIHSPEFARTREDGHEVLLQHHRQMDEVLCGLFKEGKAVGLLRADLDLCEMVCLYRGMVLVRSFRAIHDGENISLAHLVDLVLDGARARD